MADPVDPLRRRPVPSPDLRGVARSEAAAERRRRRIREREEAESHASEAGKDETGEDDDADGHVDVRA